MGRNYTWPTPGYSTITSPYGNRICPFHGPEFHNGVDIGAPNGARIVAAADGTVTLAGGYQGYGNAVIIKHGGGYSTLYGHMSRVATSSGKGVSAGDTIGYVGSTGFATGPHLHFTVYTGGGHSSTINPMNASIVGGEGGSDGSSSSSTGSSSKPVPYKEYYKTKPKNTTHVKEYHSSDTSVKITLVETQRQKTTLVDWEKLKNYYSDVDNDIKRVKKLKDLTSTELEAEYKKMINKFAASFEKVNYDNISDSDYYLFFYKGDKQNYPHIQQGKYITNPDLIYFKLNIRPDEKDEWLKLFKNIWEKYTALQLYKESMSTYKPVLSTTYYLNTAKPSITFYKDIGLKNKYAIMQTLLNDLQSSFSSYETINDINKEISDLTLQIKQLQQEMSKLYPQRNDRLKEVDKFEKMLQNLRGIQDNFKYNNFSDEYAYWNKNIIQEPNLLNFWLEFSNSNEISNYSVKNIGKKIFSSTDNNVTSIYYREIPQVIYYKDDIKRNKTGYTYIQMNNLDTLFKNSAQGISAKNVIDDLLYQHAYCTEELNLSVVPIHYLEPNTRVLIYNEATKSNNEYILNKITDALSYNGMMSLSVTKVAEKLY